LTVIDTEIDVNHQRVGTHVAVDNFVILCIFHDLEDFTDSPVNVGTRAPDENGIFSSTFTTFGTEFDYQCLISTSDPLKPDIKKGGRCRKMGTYVFRVAPFEPMIALCQRFSTTMLWLLTSAASFANASKT